MVPLLLSMLLAALVFGRPSFGQQQLRRARASAEQHREAWVAAASAAGATTLQQEPSSAPGRFSPIAFGGDPSGMADSTVALQRAIDAAFGVVNPSVWCNVSKPSHNTAVDLGGGTFKISKTLRLNKGLTFRLCCGGLVASPIFPDDAFMISGGGGLEGVTIHDVAFDLLRKGQGAVHFDSTLRVHLDRLFVHHYRAYGIKVESGHEVHVHNCWIGEWGWSENPHNSPASNLTGVAVEIDGQDHWLSDIIIFSGLRGIVLHGGASVVTNTHVYNGGNESALEVSGHAVRVLGSYFDFNRVVLVDPVAVDVSHSFFLGGVGIELRSSKPGAAIDGLSLIANQVCINRSPRVPS
eukprot:COSAG02_NODE_910_length_16005_cov_46.458569_8_plen_352_part_00